MKKKIKSPPSSQVKNLKNPNEILGVTGAGPAAGATPDVMNVWQSKADDYSRV